MGESKPCKRQRGELVPVAEVIADLPGPVQALRKTSPQARHHFTRFDQVNAASKRPAKRTPALGFMARTDDAVQPATHQPRRPASSTSDSQRPVQVDLESATGEYKLPFGTLPRLLMAWLSTEAVRTQSREISSGRLALRSSCGPSASTAATGNPIHTASRPDGSTLSFQRPSLTLRTPTSDPQFVASHIVVRGEFWWDPNASPMTVLAMG